MPALSPKHRFEITFLMQLATGCSSSPIDQGDTPCDITAIFASYMMVEGICPDDFDVREREEYPHAYVAAQAAQIGRTSGLYPPPPPGVTGADVVMGAETFFERRQLKRHT